MPSRAMIERAVSHSLLYQYWYCLNEGISSTEGMMGMRVPSGARSFPLLKYRARMRSKASRFPRFLYCFTLRMICYCAVQCSNRLRSDTLSYLFLRETVLEAVCKVI